MADVYYTYLLSNKARDAFYAGVTKDLIFAAKSHRDGLADAFTRDNKVHHLVWFRPVNDLLEALRQRARLRDLSEPSKHLLVELENPDWDDLAGQELEPLIA